MREDESGKFMEIMLAACAVYDRKPLEKAALRMYWERLRRFSLADVTAAMDTHMDRCEWFPKPSQLIERIEGSDTDNALVVWAKLISMFERGDYDVARLGQQAVNAVAAVGGSKKLGRSDYRDLDFIRKDFVEAYEAMGATVSREELRQISNEKLRLPDL